MNTGAPVTILLVEDDDVDAQGVERSLRKRKIANEIVRAVDGLDALALLQEDKVKRPYIILLDLQMPRMSGLEFLKKLRSDPQHDLSVVFVLTTSLRTRHSCRLQKPHSWLFC